MDHCYLAFDLGGSSGRAVVGVLSEERLALHEVHRFDTPVIEQGGRLFWDVEALWQEVREGIRRARASYSRLESVSVDSWAVDYVPLDAAGRVLRNPFCYRDPRTTGRLNQAFENVPADEIYERTGIQMMEINTLPQMLAEIDEEPDLVARTDLRLFIADYVLFRMGGRPVTDRTMASTTQLMNVHSGEWDVDLMARMGIPTDQWPEIVDSGTVTGRLDPALADGADIAVIAGCSHDTAAAVAGVPAESTLGRWAYICCGTWSLLGAELDVPCLSDAARRANFTNEAGLDGTIRFLKNYTGLWVLQECEREWREKGETFSYRQLLQEADRAPVTGASVNLEEPMFRQRGQMIEKLRSYCERHGLPAPDNRGGIVRLILESLSEIYRAGIEALESLLEERIDVIHVVGGGSRNELLCDWTATACGIPVVAGPDESAVVGNLLVQARTLGHLPENTTLREVAGRSFRLKTFHPPIQANRVS